MAIVKMKRLRVIAMARDRDRLLASLLHLGCVQLDEPSDKLADPEWSALLRREDSALSERRTRLGEVNTALDAIKRYGVTKEKALHLRPGVTEEVFLSDQTVEKADRASAEINGLLRELSRLQSEEGRLEARKAGLLPWAGLDVPLELDGSPHTVNRLEVCPASVDLRAVEGELGELCAALSEVGADKQQKYIFLLCHRADEEPVQEVLRRHGFSVTGFSGYSGTVKDNIAALDAQLSENRAAQAETEKRLSQCESHRDALRLYADRLETEVNRESSTESLLTDGTVLFFEGWAPAERMSEVGKVLDEFGCAWEAADPTEEQYPVTPVALKNNAFTRPLNMVTDMYSLPAYNAVDPNPLMSVFFILFYGIMMADMGYGLVMMLVSYFVIKKSRPNGPTMKHMMPLMGYCGLSTFIMGALTGGFFGDFIPRLVDMLSGKEFKFPGPNLDPVSYAVPILIGSLVIGVIHIFFGMGVSVYMKLKRGQTLDAVCNEITWYAVFALGAAGLLTGNKVFLWVILALLLVTQSYGKQGVVGKFMGVFGSLYSNVTGYFSDILSYSRLMALMLAGAVIAQVFNTIGQITGNVVLYFIIAMVGNAMNFALNLLGCYVHDMRLQCLEFFGRFYEDGGKPFRPLEIKTKYVDIVK